MRQVRVKTREAGIEADFVCYAKPFPLTKDDTLPELEGYVASVFNLGSYFFHSSKNIFGKEH